MSFLKNKKVLVTGGSGMIGRQLVNLLIEKDAKELEKKKAAKK